MGLSFSALAISFKQLFNAHCCLCQQPTLNAARFCAVCTQAFSSNSPACSICASPVESDLALICATCLQKPPIYHQCISAWRFELEIKQMIHAFKYQGRLDYGNALSHTLVKTVWDNYPEKNRPSLLIPVPLHHSHLRKRGFNQAQEICRVLSHQLKIPYRHDLIYRTKNTQSQHTLNAEQRVKNLRDAFTLNSAFSTRIQSHRHVAIVDDVVTTSSTCNEMSRLLKEHGVERVDIWSLARASRLH